jgi:hypothetical protein
MAAPVPKIMADYVSNPLDLFLYSLLDASLQNENVLVLKFKFGSCME